MGDVEIWVGLLILIVLTVTATLNLALRIPSTVRIAEHFDREDRDRALERFVALRPQFLLATAILRTAAKLGMLVVCLGFAGDMAAMKGRNPLVLAFPFALAMVMVFGVAIPNAWAKYSGSWMIVRLLPLLRAIRWLTMPLIVVLQLFDPFVRRLAGVPAEDAQSTADELERKILDMVSEGEIHGAVDEQEKEMIESVIDLRDTLVEQIMTPRTDVEAVSKDTDLATAKKLIKKCGHSRIPVYEGTIDTVLGVLYAKDLLHLDVATPFDAAKIMRKVSFIPETKHVRDLLHEFQEQKVHIAVVLDEYGGTAGLVTIEDILEELVGEITDEYETTELAPIKRIDGETVEVDARMRIEDLNDQLDIELPEDEDYETIGGFVFTTLGRIPVVGEHCEHNGIGIDVIAAEPRRVTRLRVHTKLAAHNGRNEQ